MCVTGQNVSLCLTSNLLLRLWHLPLVMYVAQKYRHLQTREQLQEHQSGWAGLCCRNVNNPQNPSDSTKLNSEFGQRSNTDHQRDSAHRGPSGARADVCSMEICTSTIQSRGRGMWLIKFCSYVMNITESFHQPRQITWLGLASRVTEKCYPTTYPEGEPEHPSDHTQTQTQQNFSFARYTSAYFSQRIFPCIP